MSHQPRISCIAIIGKQNNPLYLKTFPKPPSTPLHVPSNPSSLLPQPSPSLKYHFLAHSAIDIFEERIVSGAKTIDTYFGLLHVLEDVSVYRFLTNTHVKIVVMIEGGDGSGGIRDSDVKAVSPPFWNMFNDLVIRRIHDAYVGVVFNPFYVPEDKEGIISAKFDRDIERIGREWKTII